jgi:methyltransferase (TIGR00027 family)
VLKDEVGLRLVAPEEGWRDRPDMDPRFTSRFRASIVARARFIEDVVAEQAEHDVSQYVILGAGLDTFAQRRPQVGSRIQVFEVEQPATQAWKRQRLLELGYGVPPWLHLVPVDFEAGASWRDAIAAAGFDAVRPAVVSSTGVSMYLTQEANLATLRDMASLAPGSTLVMSFLVPVDLLDAEDRTGVEISGRGAAASGTPFISFYRPEEIVALAGQAGFREADYVSGDTLNQRYFAGRTDGLRTSNGEQLLVAKT